MKNINLSVLIPLFSLLLCCFNGINAAVINGNFENGLTGWMVTTNYNRVNALSTNSIGDTLPYVKAAGLTTAPYSLDLATGNSLPTVYQGNYAAQLYSGFGENNHVDWSRISQNVYIDPGFSVLQMNIAAVVSGYHSAQGDPPDYDAYVVFEVFDATTGASLLYQQYSFAANTALLVDGDQTTSGTGGGPFKFLPWQTEQIDLSMFAGKNIVISFTAYDCEQGGHFSYAYLDGITLIPSYTPTITLTSTRTSTPTATKTVTKTFTATNTNTVTPTATRTVTVTVTLTVTPTATKTSTSTCTITATPTATRTFTQTSTDTATPTATATDTITVTSTFTKTSTLTSTTTVTKTVTPTITASKSFTPTVTITNTYTNTPTSTPSYTQTSTRTNTPTDTVTLTATPTFTITYTRTFTPTATCTLTATPTNTVTRTATLTSTATGTPTITETSTMTFTKTATSTDTATRTITSTATPTGTPTGTFTRTMTSTGTATVTPTKTITPTATVTPTPKKIPAPTFLLKISVYNEAGELVKNIAETEATNNITAVMFYVGGVEDAPFTNAKNPFGIYLEGVFTSVPATAAGTTFYWDGTNSGGQPVENGLYYIKVEEIDAYGHAITKNGSMIVARQDEYTELNIYNSAGEIVRRIKDYNKVWSGLPVSINMPDSYMINDIANGTTAQPLKAYFSQNSSDFMLWDGMNDGGTMVTSGSYEIEIVINKGGYTVKTSKSIVVLVDKIKFLGNLKIYPCPYSGQAGGITFRWDENIVGAMTAGTVKIKIYNAAGELSAEFSAALADGKKAWKPGGAGMSPGVYVCVLEGKSFSGRIDRKIGKFALLTNQTE